MVRIKKGNTELIVSKCAYESYYKESGFELLSEPRAAEYDLTQETVHPEDSPHIGDESMREEDSEEDSEEEDEKDVDGIDYSEIPLSELTLDQLRDYADQLGLDHAGIKSDRGLRALIKANR